MSFYNVYIQHSVDEKIYMIVLNQQQIDKLINAFLDGERNVRIKGVDRNINNPSQFIIYSINASLKDPNLTQEEMEKEMNVYGRVLNNGKMSIAVYRFYGTNITDDLTGGESWGSRKDISNKQIANKTKHNTGKIFISHSVKDTKVVQNFTENILQIGLNIDPKSQIFNISIEDAGIRTGEDFRDKILSELKNAKAIIQIITEDYKKSEACLNEMGAAWALDVPVIPFILEPVTYSNVGFIHNPRQLLKLNSKKDLKTFVAQHKNQLFSVHYDDSKLDRKIDDFIKTISIDWDSEDVVSKLM